MCGTPLIRLKRPDSCFNFQFFQQVSRLLLYVATENLDSIVVNQYFASIIGTSCSAIPPLHFNNKKSIE